MAGLRARSQALAQILGVDVPVVTSVTDSVWLYSDTASEKFNMEVPVGLLTIGAGAYVRGSKGMVIDQVGEIAVDEFVERVRIADREEWLAEKRSGAGRDPRLSSLVEDTASPYPLFREATALMRAPSGSSRVFTGPAACTDAIGAVGSSGLEPMGYQAQWTSASGVAPKSGVCIEHGLLLTVLWMLATVDRLNLYALAGAEMASCRILQIERAVRMNPRQPDFEGLETYISHALDSSGGIMSTAFDRYVASTQKDVSFIMKQSRLAKEELEADQKRRVQNPKPKKGGKGSADKEED